jgi:hypothetical protein
MTKNEYNSDNIAQIVLSLVSIVAVLFLFIFQIIYKNIAHNLCNIYLRTIMCFRWKDIIRTFSCGWINIITLCFIQFLL